MTILSKDKVLHAIQAFVMFLNISKDVQAINFEELEAIKEKVVELMDHLISDKVETDTASLHLNELISKVNQSLTAPYPSIVSTSTENFVKSEIVAFEHYLNQELKAKHLSVQEEAPLFNDSVQLWEKVGSSLSAKEGVCEFCALVAKLNQMLPQDEHYPLPDENQY